MTPSDISLALDDLDRSPGYRALRFDPGAPLGGRVAVLPSAFNPPTLAHLYLLQVAQAVDGVGGGVALLTTRNVAKAVVGATLADRVGMLLASREEQPSLSVVAANAARLADQAKALRASFPGTSFDFVVGYDTLIRLFDEVYYEDMPAQLGAFFSEHRVIATNRGEISIEAVREFVAGIGRPFRERIVVREIGREPASLSSTAARMAIAHGDEPLAIPAGVAAYIRGHGLYRSGLASG